MRVGVPYHAARISAQRKGKNRKIQVVSFSNMYKTLLRKRKLPFPFAKIILCCEIISSHFTLAFFDGGGGKGAGTQE